MPTLTDIRRWCFARVNPSSDEHHFGMRFLGVQVTRRCDCEKIKSSLLLMKKGEKKKGGRGRRGEGGGKGEEEKGRRKRRGGRRKEEQKQY